MRNAIADVVLVAIIGLVAAVITVVFEKETNNSFTKIIYQDDNITKCEKDRPGVVVDK